MELTVSKEPLTESNCYLLSEGGRAVVIDPNDAAAVPRLLRERGWTPEMILLTHEHCDHIAGLTALREQFSEARVIASQDCSRGLQNRRLNMSLMMEVYFNFKGEEHVTYPPFVCGPATLTYLERFTLRWRGHTIRCVPLPGHTPGSSGFFWDEKLFFSGDYLIPGEPVILRFPGGSPERYRQVTSPFLESLPAGLQVLPGHGSAFILGKEGGVNGSEQAAESAAL